MIELRSQINFRISPDCNIGLTITHIGDAADDTEVAEAAGRSDARLVTAYLRGYGAASEEIDQEASS